MSSPIITVENLSKRYVIGHQRAKDDGLRHTIETAVRNPFGWLKPARKARTEGQNEEFWALKDVSFEVKQGEVVGIIGRNGAGKSTLLKILSRITEPTSGRIRLKGRVASLLEVGTGFHPELTGRENIFLNGAILGMSKKEIKRKFDEIVAFSEIEKFLDTPVKRYSSGMYVRLAFAVAAHLEPDILVIDEVLAVGDASFQTKCLGKMNEVSKHGRTVLFVSHNMPTIANLCQRVVMLRSGTLAREGKPQEVINGYLAEVSSLNRFPLAERRDRSGTGEAIVTAVEILDQDGTKIESVITGQPLRIRMYFRCQTGRLLRDSRAGLAISLGGHVYIVLSTWMVDSRPLHLEGKGSIEFALPELPLTAGIYCIHAFLESNELYDSVENAAELSVVDGDFYHTGKVRPTLEWQNVGVLIRYNYHVTCGRVALNIS